MSEKVDVVVIGMGPGGEDLAGSLAQGGMRVVGVESRLLGGECPYFGCIPSKMMIRAGNMLAEGRRIPGHAGSSTIEADWAPVARRIRDEATDNWDDKAAVERFEAKGGIFVRGHGRLSGERQVTVGDRVFDASVGVVLNTGTRPAVPPIPGLADVPYWTNREAIKAETLPASMIVLGGGSIGVELAHVFSRFGVRVTVVEAGDRLMAFDEPEAGELIANVFGHEGLVVRTSARVVRVHAEGGGTAVELEGGEQVVADRLLVATGRRTNLGDLGLESVGLDPKARFVETDGHMRAGPGLWAIGDITGHGMFTHMSMYHAGIAAADIRGEEGPGADYRAVPRVSFTDPEVGAVGMTEAAAREKSLDIRTGIAQVRSSARGFIHGVGNEGFIKLVEDRSRGVLVGATSVGPTGGEVLSMLALAVRTEVPVATLRHMIYAYPTFHRGIEDALRDLGSA
ncbi:MAG TPA: NAD(P)/FAD-dependent oxidoreductase [Candidatus Dormibacteraeota bacterium]|jgi:pyruvate/2-oxoglutarate dehydrogenase complex dihydrolipoamide dehydrogenase (E3) component|nr:NAD(P)/FAD-dependent oxidoreductase [Candidatus Dormibacteraeota bacterium]